MVARIGPLKPWVGVTLTSQEHGTLVVFESRNNLPVVMRPLSGLLDRQARKTWDARMAMIKTWMERT